MFGFVDLMVLLGVEEVMWKVFDPICGAFALQQMLAK